MPVKTYLALGTKNDIVARVTAEIGNSYYGYFGDKISSFQSISLMTRDFTHLNAYVHRSTPAYKELMGIVADGNPHDVTLGICNINDDTEYPVIKTMLSRTWIMPDEEPKAAD